MERNKDEALRAKSIAEKKLSDKDYAGSKKFILKAQTLYPGLDGISQMLTTLDVYIASENKVGGEIDWYGILGANPNDDDETIRKHYRKLAFMLHPDKNKYIGADGAFKLLSEAWSLLSDKAKRLAYNQKRIMRGFHVKVPSQSGGPPPAANGVPSFTKRATTKSNIRSHHGPGPGSVPPVVSPAALAAPPSPPVVSRRTDTFWTICHGCKMHYEYLNLYLNHTLLCRNCFQPFLAKEMPPPSNLSKSTAPKQHQNSSNHGRTTAAARKLTETEMDLQAQTEIKTESQTETEAEAETKTEAQTETEPEATTKAQTETEPEATTKAQTETEPEAITKAQTETGPEATTGPGSQTETVTKSGPTDG